ncbi:hypothetical protein OIU79_009717, partial [Salix purpurea]
MFKNTFQSDFCRSKPLQIWDKE